MLLSLTDNLYFPFMKNTDIQIATSLLGKEGIVFAIVKDGDVLFTSTNKGIQPFFDALEQRIKVEYIACSLADRVIGKAALLLAAYLGAKHIYTPLASQHAVDAALELNLDVRVEKVVPYIVNRTQDGMCPMEEAVLNVSDPKEAFKVLTSTLEGLRKS
jgi:Domain of unknown function (DUF1893)